MGLYDDLEKVQGVPPAPAAPRAPAGMYEGLELVQAPGTPGAPPKEASGLLESLQAGLQGSAPGLAWRRRLPDLAINPDTASWWERAAASFAHVGAELPLMIGGAAVGGPAGAAVAGPAGGILGAGFAMGVVPATIRQSLIEAYKAGEANTPIDWFNAVREVAKQALIEGGVNAAAMGAGAVAKGALAAARGASSETAKAIAYGTATPLTRAGAAASEATDLATQIATMVAVPAVIEQRMPKAQEFIDAAILIGGLKAAHITASRMMTTYQKTGRTPAEQVQDAQQNPELAAELTRPEVDPTTGTTSGVPVKMDRLIAEAEFLARGGVPEAPNIRQLIKEIKAEGPLQGDMIQDIERIGAIYEKARMEPLSDPERAELGVLKARVAELEAKSREASAAEPAVAAFTPDQTTEARRRAEERLAALEAKDGALTDAERAERVFLKNARPEAIARHFGLEPEGLPRRITAEEREASAQKVHDDVLQQLRDVDRARQEAGLQPLGDDHALAVAALVRARVRTRAARMGMLPEEIYNERPLQIRDETAIEVAAAEAEIPPGAPTFVPPEVDLFGAPIAAPMVPRHLLEGMPVHQVPVASLKLSLEVPQFKKDANEKGVVQPLGGEPDPRGWAIQVWERLNGDLEVISGRHRWELWQRRGVEKIPAQIHREADGFTAKMAAILDAELNIRDEQGSVADYVQYFKDSELTKEAADERGLLARAKGKSAFAIARDGTDDLIAANRAGVLSDEAALAISAAAPGSDRLQALGIAMVNEGKSILMAVNTMKAVDMMAAERMAAGAQGDIFGFDDSAMREAAAMAKKASSEQRRISEQISAVNGASKRPELARKMGVDVQDPDGIRKRITELKQEQELWDNWPLHPELVARLRGGATKPVTGREGELKQGPVGVMSAEEAASKGFTLKAYRGVSKANPFNNSGTVWATTSRDVAESYAREVFGYDDAHVIEIMVKPEGIPRHDIRKLTEEQTAALEPDEFGNPQKIGIYANSDDSMLGSGYSHTAIHVPADRVMIIERFASDFDLKPETPAELEARNREAAAQAMRKVEREMPGKKVTADQADLFNTQGTLFQAKRLPEEVRVAAVKEYAEGATAESVAEKYDIGTSTVMRWAAYEGLARSGPETKGVTQKKRAEAIKMYEEGSSIAEVAKELGIGSSTVHRIVKAEGINRTLRAVTGAPAEVREDALRMYSEGLNSYEVAEQLGLSQTTVSKWAVDAGISRGWSGAQALRVALGRNTGYGIKIPFKSSKSDGELMAPSTYELARFGQLQADENVASFRKARDRIQYGDGKTYVPDIEIRYADGRIAVEEIKPEYLLDDATVQAKAEAARAFYAERGVEYRMVTERTIGLDGFDTIKPEKMDLSAGEQKRLRGALATVRSYLRKVNAEESPDNDTPPFMLFQKERGSYQIAEKLITTMQGADRSTVVHELGHDWLEEMKADASRPDAPAQIKADWDLLRRELAIGEDGTIERASHEQFARSIERYVMEGEAPSVGLRGVFERFKAWLLDIYRSVMNLNVEINPELKAVLDRMLATDQEIADARELGVPRAYVAEAKVQEARKIVPGFKAEQVSMEPYADELPKGPGEAPDSSHINYAYINSPLDVKLTMQRMAEIDQANIQRQRGGTAGVKSWAESNAEQAKYVNDVLGGNEDTLKILAPRDPDAPGPDVRLGILKKLAVGAAKDSARLRDVVLQKGHDATVREQLEYMGSIERARMIQAEFLGERASVARALNALKDVTEGSGEISRMLDAIGYGEAAAKTLFQEPRPSRTPAEEQAYLKARLDEIMLNYGGRTPLDIARLHKEIGTLKGTFKFAKEVTKATKWEMVVEGWKASLLSGPVTHTTNLFGTGAFMALRAPVDAVAALIGMARGASPGMGETDRASMSEAVARITGMLGGVQDGLRAAKATFDLQDPTGKTEAYRNAIPGRAGELIRIPLRLMGAEDALVSTMYRRSELKTLAIRQAFDENLNPLTREFADRVTQLTDNPTPEMAAAAEAAATRMSFNMPLGEKGVYLQLFVNKWNLQWMIPFIRTPINITKEVARMSAFAPLVGEWRADMAKGGVARDKALAEFVLGSGIMALTMAYAFAGNVTGGGGPDPGKNRGKAGVEQPYSIKVGDTWYEYARIQPTGTLMGMAADIAAAWDHMTPEEKDKVPRMLARAFANAVTNQTFLQGITNVINAMSDPTRFAPKFLQQLAGSMVPNVIGQPTAMADPVVREVNSAIEAIYARLPGFRETLLPKRDWLGEEVKTKERLGVVGPVRTMQVTDDKVRLEAAKLDISMAAPPKKTHIGKGTGKLGDVELTPEEQDKFERVGGEMAHQILTQVVNAPGYDNIPPIIKRRIFSQVLTASHRYAAVQALPPEKRQAYLQQITEKVVAELAPASPQ